MKLYFTAYWYLRIDQQHWKVLSCLLCLKLERRKKKKKTLRVEWKEPSIHSPQGKRNI